MLLYYAIGTSDLAVDIGDGFLKMMEVLVECGQSALGHFVIYGPQNTNGDVTEGTHFVPFKDVLLAASKWAKVTLSSELPLALEISTIDSEGLHQDCGTNTRAAVLGTHLPFTPEIMKGLQHGLMGDEEGPALQHQGFDLHSVAVGEKTYYWEDMKHARICETMQYRVVHINCIELEANTRENKVHDRHNSNCTSDKYIVPSYIHISSFPFPPSPPRHPQCHPFNTPPGSNLSKHILDTFPLLNTARQNLRSRQNKATTAAARRPQLDSPSISSTTNSSHVIRRAASSLVQRRAAGAGGEGSAVALSDPSSHARGETALRGVVGRAGGAVVPIRQEDVLAVRVPVDVEADAAAVLEGGGEGGQGSDLGGVAGGEALVGLGAGRGGGAAGEGPLVVPVAVLVGADAGLAGAGLAVLAPEAVVGLGVDESWGVC